MKKIIFILLVPIILTSCASSKFTSYEKQIVDQTDNNGRLRVFLVENPSDSLILYKKSKNIKAKASNLALKKFTQDLYNTVLDPDNLGVGIAAPQVGINRKIIWVQRFDKEEKPYELFLNIEILDYSESKKEGKEGCLSVETYSGFVNRSTEITIKYDNFENKKITETISGFTAVIFQHEIDHLNGILFIDRITDKSLLIRQ